jgi:hypothetical protein
MTTDATTETLAEKRDRLARLEGFKDHRDAVLTGNRCWEHPQYHADNCPTCGTAAEVNWNRR